MTVLNFLNSAALFIYLSLTVYALVIRPRYRSNLFFATFCFSFAIWTFGMCFMLDPRTSRGTAILCNNINSVGWTTFCIFYYWFAKSFANQEFRPRLPMIILSVILPIVFIYLQLNNRLAIVNEAISPYGWAFVWSGSMWQYLFFLYYSTFMVYGIILVARELSRTTVDIRKKQIVVIIFSTAVTLILGTLSNVFFPMIHYTKVPPVAHLTTLIWVGGIAFAVSRYKLLLLTPALASRDILQTMDEGLLLVDTGNRIIDANNAAFQILSVKKKELLHSDIARFMKSLSLKHDETSTVAINWPPEELGNRTALEVCFEKSGGIIRYLRIHFSNVIDKLGQTFGTVVIFRDITDEKKARSQIEYMATHDFLTGLANRNLLREHFSKCRARAHRFESKMALLVLDMNRFKEINDTLGHTTGDLVLKAVARRLRKSVRDYDVVSRMGGDEFIILLNDIKDNPQVDMIIERIAEDLKAPVIIDSHHLEVSASIGISLYPHDAPDLGTLIRMADTAMYDAKKHPDRICSYYSNDMSMPAGVTATISH